MTLSLGAEGDDFPEIDKAYGDLSVNVSNNIDVGVQAGATRLDRGWGWFGKVVAKFRW